jgi:hypothetical protein
MTYPFVSGGEDDPLAPSGLPDDPFVSHPVLSLRTEPGGLAVQFRGPAAIYLLGEGAPGFAASVAKLAESWRTGEPVAVRLGGSQILDVA